MSPTAQKLEALCKEHPKFLAKGGLCVGLVVTETARARGLPLDPEDLRTEEGGQVAGLGQAAVQKILEAHGITKILAKEGGRTSRGSRGLMKAYVAVLNRVHEAKALSLDEAIAWWVQKVHAHFASEGLEFHFDVGKSLRANIEDLLTQAAHIQAAGGGNLKAGLKPIIVTLSEAVRPAEFIPKNFDLKDRVDVLDAAQFLTANVYERSLFRAAQCKIPLSALLERYNAIVEGCETDPSLRIKLAR